MSTPTTPEKTPSKTPGKTGTPPTPDDRMQPVDPGAAAQKEGAEDQEESSYS